MMRALLALLALSFLAACGGGGSVVSESRAQSTSQTVHQIHAIVRPDASGRWFVQNDADHAPVGIVGVTQTSEYLEVLLDRTYSHAGVVQVTLDDDFNGFYTVGSNLGLSALRIRIKSAGVQINPANIYSYAPVTPGSGNLWVSATMVQRTPF